MDEQKKQRSSSLRITTKEQEDLIKENINLVYDIINMYEIPGTDMYDDLISIGNMTLVKAAILFNPDKKVKFSTYASKSIKREMFRYKKKQYKKSSVPNRLVEPLLLFDEDGEMIDVIEDMDSDFTEKILEREWALHILNIMLNILKPKHAAYMLMIMTDNTRTEICNKMNVSKQRGVQIQTLALGKIRKYLKKPKKRQRRFRIYKELDLYKFVFEYQDSEKNIEIFKALCNNESIKKLSNYKILCDEMGIILESNIEQYFFEAMAYAVEIISKVIKN